MVNLKSKREIGIMRDAGRIAASVLEELRGCCKAGVLTKELDRRAEQKAAKLGAESAFKGYRGYPCALCTSINHQVVHGIPGDTELKTGDIVGWIWCLYKGYFGDAAITVPIGEIPDKTKELILVTEECLYLGIEQMVSGNHLSDLSRAIQKHAESHGFSLVKEFGGHGIGKHMHEDPMVLNYVVHERGILLRPGIVLAIEPMVNMGTDKVQILSDGWTVVTLDGKPSAHFEHTVAITEDGPEILQDYRRYFYVFQNPSLHALHALPAYRAAPDAAGLACVSCDARSPVRDGILDMAGEDPSEVITPFQRLMQTPVIVSIYERLWRQIGYFLASSRSFSKEMQTVLRLQNARDSERVLDLACGTGVFTRPLARQGGGLVVGLIYRGRCFVMRGT
jgi:methionyl aminopeptidase